MDLSTILSNIASHSQLSSDLSEPLLRSLGKNADSNSLLNCITNLLLEPDKSFVVAKTFLPLLPELLERSENVAKDHQVFILLANLIGHFRYATQYVYRKWNGFGHQKLPYPKSFRFSSSTSHGSKRRKLDEHEHSPLCEHFLKACLTFLWYDRQFFLDCFDWSVLLQIKVPDRPTSNNYSYYFWIINRILCGDSEDAIGRIIRRFQEYGDHSLQARLQCLNIIKTRVPIELNEVSDEMSSLIEQLSLSTSIVNVCGVLMHKVAGSHPREMPFIMVDSVCKNLKALAYNIASGHPCIVEGPVGCGKTSLVEYLASKTGRLDSCFMKIQMGDQIDSKILIGSYHCTELPGEFIWKAGPLTESMVQGKWLLLEDIDAATTDVISTIVSAIKSRQLSSLPGCNVSGNTNGDFRIFFTRRTGEGNRLNSNEIDKISQKIVIEDMSEDELKKLVEKLYPSMSKAKLLSSILETYFLAKNFVCDVNDQDCSTSIRPFTSRNVSLRDLLKWVHRISSYQASNVNNLAYLAFKDAVDCFIPDPIFQVSKVEALGTHLNFSKKQAHTLCFGNPSPPKFDCDELMSVGRARLKRMPVDRLKLHSSTNSSFAFTTPTVLLMERISASLVNNEPVLLVGETGCGKTSVVQYLAQNSGRELTVVNLNQQSDSADLIGGYKPVDLSLLIEPVREKFGHLVRKTFTKNNDIFLGKVNQCFSSKRYKDLFQVVKVVGEKVFSIDSKPQELKDEWRCLLDRIDALTKKFIDGDTKQALLAFSFVEGSLVKCVREGGWILLDEINLAEVDTLHSLSALLDTGSNEKVTLIDKADGLPITKHPEFRVFACMNPATDIGKRDLPLGIRHRFTEFYVDEIREKNDLTLLVQKYLPTYNQPGKLVQFYLAAKEMAVKTLVDTTGHRPHYSLRTLCRALAVASSNPCGDLSRSLHESFSMSFLTQLDSSSKNLVSNLICKYIFGDGNHAKAALKKPIPRPSNDMLLFGDFWVPVGTEKPVRDPKYIFTECVSKNLNDLARVISIGKKFPVLLQGETSVGKTSLIQWLAKASGNVCRRVNNHEHTDLEEYIGSYVTDESGNLVFKEGILVEAMRKGYWIILDELNLAPTEILEALNRLLDDNRELFIAETRKTVKAHPSFLLFATQNPPGLYGGRKMLSRAFRNRFIELHFEEIAKDQLIEILEQRCSLPNSYARKMVKAMTDLQKERRSSQIFAGKAGFITLRDLFRWGDRHAKSSRQIEEPFYDWDMHLVTTGYMLLAGKVRKAEEAQIVRQVLESNFLRNKKKLDPIKLIDDQYNLLLKDSNLSSAFKHLVPTPSFKRLLVLLWNALMYKEPVLLVGQTGCGKTTACQIYSKLNKHPLEIINCHMNSDGSDFLGSLRPVRDHSSTGDTSCKLFEWVDGPLVKALKMGQMFLIDEISLADDSVLERLNSLLEPDRTILLAEKSGADHEDALVVAHESFLLAATMNPGDDFGKKELSPALRNRFTEIWCPTITSKDEFKQVIVQNLDEHLAKYSSEIADVMSSYYFWFTEKFSKNNCISFRDILSWVTFVNKVTSNQNSMEIDSALMQGAFLVLIDALGCSGTSSFTSDAKTSFSLASEELAKTIRHKFPNKFASSLTETELKVGYKNNSFGIHPFYIERTSWSTDGELNYSFDSVGVSKNCFKILRAMQLHKPILLEGPPGVGKTSLINALAVRTGHKVVRINLSEQSDIADLFGSDLPVEGNDTAGKFEWRDGPLLLALKTPNTWIMLDELNLAPQSVLEGLNSCLDHRGEIFVPELGRSFLVNKQSTRIFAAQNPQAQGGDRKGLPRSFLNRFTNVYIDSFTENDLIAVALDTFNSIDQKLLVKLVQFNQRIVHLTQKHEIGISGSPFEFNFRDVSRTCQLVLKNYPLQYAIQLIYVSRFRSVDERKTVISTYEDVFSVKWTMRPQNLLVTPKSVNLPSFLKLKRKSTLPTNVVLEKSGPFDINCMNEMISCIDMNWLAILVGSKECHLMKIAENVAYLTGNALKVFYVHPEIDALELLGGFEKKDIRRKINQINQLVRSTCLEEISRTFETECLGPNRVLYEKRSERTKEGKEERIRIWNSYMNFHKMVHLSDQEFKFSAMNKALNKLLEFFHGDILTQINDLVLAIEELSSTSISGSFEWVDSQVVSAAINGHWLVIEDANLCAASVLDRLNSLFEPNGSLVLSEKGSIGDSGLQTIRPHPDFRVIMTIDPSRGEMSRAMRNRGVEIFVDQTTNPSFKCIDVSALAADPVLENVCEFDLDSYLTSDQCLNSLVALIFLQYSSLEDFDLRKELLEQKLNGEFHRLSRPHGFPYNPKSHYEPFDRRVLFGQNTPPHPDKLFNHWNLCTLIKISDLMHMNNIINPPLSRVISLDPIESELDELDLFYLRLYGITRCNSQKLTDEVVVSQLSRRLSSRLHDRCPSLVDKSDLFDNQADAWESVLYKMTSSITLVYDVASGSTLKKIVDFVYIYRSNVEKYTCSLDRVLASAVESLFGRKCPTKEIDEISAKISLLERGHEDATFTRSTHHESSLFDTFFFLWLEKTCIASESSHSYLNSMVNCAIHPLHKVYLKWSKAITEHLLYHLLDSRWFFEYSFKVGLIPELKECTSVLTHLICNILTSNSFKLDSISERISLLKNIFSSLSKQFSPLTRSASSSNFNAQHFSAIRMWLVTFGKFETRPEVLEKLNQLSETPEDFYFEFQVGLLTCDAFLPVSKCDPSELKYHEVEHLKENWTIFSSEIELRRKVGLAHMGSLYDDNLVLFLPSLCKVQQYVKDQMDQVSSSIVYRMDSRYSSLQEKIFQFKSSVLDPCSRIDLKSTSVKQVSHLNYARSCSHFATLLLRDYVDYYDLINPFITGLLMVAHSLENYSNCAKPKSSTLIVGLLEELINFFPNDPYKLIDLLCNKSLSPEIEKFIDSSSDYSQLVADLTIHGLSELHLQMSTKCSKVKIINFANTLLEQFVRSWLEMKENEKSLREAEEALVHYKTHDSGPSDEEIDAKVLGETFPTFTFDDITEDLTSSQPTHDAGPDVSSLSNEKLAKLVKLHVELVLNPEPKHFVDTLPLRYKVIQSLLSSKKSASLTLQDGNSIALHMVTLCQTLDQITTDVELTKIDVYHENCASEINVCSSVLFKLSHQLDSMLIEFPDHPTLTKISTFTKRILSFDVRSPLIKFLTGLELLLGEMQKWDTNYAHKAIKLTTHLESITQLILKWRKLELNQWSCCLESVHEKVNNQELTHWWFRLFELLSTFDLCTNKEIIVTLRQLITCSSIAGFFIRLELLRTFCQQSYLLEGPDCPKFILLSNLIKFYTQCRNSVEKQLLDERTVIEKQVKEFVSLMQWTDMNYFSLRHTIEKSHRTLIRHMRKFQDTLKGPALPHLKLGSLSAEKTDEATIRKFDRMIRTVEDTNVHFTHPVAGYDLNILLSKMKGYSKQLSGHLSQIKGKVDENEEMISLLISRINELQTLSVDSSITDKEEHRKAVHHIGNLKRKALSDLFKWLSQAGFNWSSGILQFNKADVNELLSSVAPIEGVFEDLDVLLDKYYYSCLFSFEELNSSLRQPSKDLDSNAHQRIVGFTGFFLTTLTEQRKQLSTLISFYKKFHETCQTLENSFKQGSVTRETEENIRSVIVKTEIILKKIHIFITITSKENDSNEYSELLQNVNSAIESIEQVKLNSPASAFHCDGALKICIKSIDRIVRCRNPQVEDHLSRELTSLKEELNRIEDLPQNKSVGEISTVLLFSLLKSVEKLIKFDKETSMGEDSSLLKSWKLNKYLSIVEVNGLLEEANKIDEALRKGLIHGSANYLAFFSQFCHLIRSMIVVHSSAHYSLGKLFHILYNLFSNLSTKGFCLPGELDDSKTSDGQTLDREGMGLDEGQGVKDVSDRITSQDELEGLMKESQQQPDTDDVEEQENAVEFEDDFEGKEYDQSKPADDDDDEKEKEESDNEADRQMGKDVTDDDSALDKKMWQDEEESEEENIEDETSQTGKGEEFGEDQIVAKDDTRGERSKDEEEDENDGKEKKKDEINNQPEMDDEYEGEKIDPYKSVDAEVPPANEGEDEDLGDINLDDDGNDSNDEAMSETASEKSGGESMEQETDQPISDSEFQDDSEKVDHEMAQDQNESDDAESMDDRLEHDPISHENKAETQPSNELESNAQNAQTVECTDDALQNASNQEPKDNNNNQGNSKQVSESVGATDSASNTVEGSSVNASNVQQQKQQSQQRSLAQSSEEARKKRQIQQRQLLESEKEAGEKQESDLLMHVDEDEDFDGEAMDTALEENDAKGVHSKIEESSEEQDDIVMQDEDEQANESASRRKLAEKTPDQRTEEKGVQSNYIGDTKAEMNVEASADENVATMTASRGQGTTSHTNVELLLSKSSRAKAFEQIESTIAKLEVSDVSPETAVLWSQCSRQVDSLVFELCQQLQLVLEPAKCAKLKGDYRTGKRINMRKVIAFIASQFRKDKIWLRRTKPSKRTYQIVLAVDDSQSMLENQSKIAAIQSLALLSRALSLIEAGQVGIVKFGEDPVLLQSLEQQFSESKGPQILESFSFQQSKTNVAALVRQVTSIFNSSRSLDRTTTEFSQLLIIISDGRGVFSDGQAPVLSAIREMIDQGIFCVFLIMDNPANKQSIFDIESFSFQDDKFIRSFYMDQFPFPFYLVVRDIATLPAVLGESLRQWFELVTGHK